MGKSLIFDPLFLKAILGIAPTIWGWLGPNWIPLIFTVLVGFVHPINQIWKNSEKGKRLEALKNHWGDIVKKYPILWIAYFCTGLFLFSWGYNYGLLQLPEKPIADNTISQTEPVSMWVHDIDPEVIYGDQDLDDQNKPYPKVHFNFQLEIVNNTDETRFVRMKIKNVYTPIPSNWGVFSCGFGMLKNDGQVLNNNEVEIDSKKENIFNFQIIFHTPDERTEDFYKSLLTMHKNFKIKMIVSTDRNETTETLLSIKFRECFVEKYKENFNFLDFIKKTRK